MKIVILFGLLVAVLGESNEKYRQLFTRIDSNKDGFVRREEVTSYFASFDINGNGMLSLAEFKPSEAPTTHSIITQGTFNYFDEVDGTEDKSINLAVSNTLFNLLDNLQEDRVDYAVFCKSMGQVYESVDLKIRDLLG